MGKDRSRLLSAAATGLVGIICSGAAGAQVPAAADPADQTAQPVEPSDDAQTDEDIVVTGFRGSLQRTLELKRNSNAVVDSIVAEDIAKFADNNLAESIQRVAAVTITRDGGEGRNISVRCLGAEFTRVRIDENEAQATTGSNRGRGFDFNVFASAIRTSRR
jgi:outer membrane receptor for ferrienterochelin and colicin